MKQRTARLGDTRNAAVPAPSSPRPSASTSKLPGLALESPFQRRAISSDGIVVQEDELGSVLAQRLYKMRCECGRSWFELELPKLVKCPACLRINLVSEHRHLVAPQAVP